MSILQLTASKDNTITNAFLPDVVTRAEYSNMGAADSLEVFSLYYSSSAGLDPQKSRILIKFPLEQFVSARASGKLPASGSVNFYLKLSNVEHPYTVPSQYWLTVKPVSASWDEGTGLDMESYGDYGSKGTSGYGSNWQYATSDAWSANGGDYVESYSTSQYFDAGLEDLNVDVTTIVEAQIGGTIPDEGFGVMLSSSFENPSENEDYYTKKFSARSSEYFFKTPKLEARWESYNKDDRGDFYFSSPNLSNLDNKQNLYFYNKVNGSLKDLPASIVPDISVKDSNGVLYGTGSVSKIATGAYKGVISVTGSENETLYDYWHSGSTVFYTGNIDAKVRTFEDTSVQNDFIFSITNAKSTYSKNETAVFKIYSRKKDWSPTVYTVSNKDIENYVHKNLYYKIYRIVDNYTVIDYGISPVAYTKCSYDKNGNYFSIEMNMFEPGYGYAIKFAISDQESIKECNETFRFKVE